VGGRGWAWTRCHVCGVWHVVYGAWRVGARDEHTKASFKGGTGGSGSGSGGSGGSSGSSASGGCTGNPPMKNGMYCATTTRYFISKMEKGKIEEKINKKGLKKRKEKRKEK
jgi:hypothetical protein